MKPNSNSTKLLDLKENIDMLLWLPKHSCGVIERIGWSGQGLPSRVKSNAKAQSACTVTFFSSSCSLFPNMNIESSKPFWLGLAWLPYVTWTSKGETRLWRGDCFLKAKTWSERRLSTQTCRAPDSFQSTTILVD